MVVNAAHLARRLAEAGLTLVSGGTDNHMLLVDVSSLGLTGKAAEAALHLAGITVNKNAIPYETLSPMVTSGIRIGTPFVTSRGMGTPQMEVLAAMIVDVLKNPEDDAVIRRNRERALELCRAFPLFGTFAKEAQV